MEILLVDDEPDFLEQAKIFLEKENNRLKVDTTTSVEKALKMIEENNFDAIVADYVMPEMDGLELLKRVRDKGIGTLFFVLTARGDEKSSYKALNLGATGYFKKTGNPEKVFSKLGKIVTKSVDKKRTKSKHLIAWITLRKGWGGKKEEEFKEALERLGELIGFEIAEIETRMISTEKENLQAYTDDYTEIPKAKEWMAKNWKKIVVEEPEVIDAGFKSETKIQRFKPSAE